MNGIDKITEAILADAKHDADVAACKASEQAESIVDGYRLKADAILDDARTKAEKEGAQLIERSKASSNMNHRNTLLKAKSSQLDTAFEKARKALVMRPDAEYAYILGNILKATVKEQMENERLSLEHDTEGEYVIPTEYSILFNRTDYLRIADVMQKKAAELGKEVGKTITVSKKPANIDGGFILAVGNIELNCSTSVLIGQLRTTLESRVYAELFD